MKLNRNARSDCRAAHSSSSGMSSTRSATPGRRADRASRPEMPLEERADLRGDPRRHVDAVGDRTHRQRSNGTPGQIDCHICLVTSPCSRLTPLTAPLVRKRQRGHVEHRTAAVVVVAERQEPLAIRAEVAPRAGQVRFDQMERKRVVARRHRRVRREHRACGAPRRARLEARTRLAQIANPLQDDERGVPFVEVIGRRRAAHRLQHAHAADAEDDLLLHARFAIAAIEARRQLAIPRRVLLEIGVEQIQRDPAHAHAPHRHEHRAVAERHRGDARASRRGSWPARSAAAVQFSFS